jgi:hypothetical protein
VTGKEDLHEDRRLWPHIQGWAAELGLTGPEEERRLPAARRHQPPE